MAFQQVTGIIMPLRKVSEALMGRQIGFSKGFEPCVLYSKEVDFFQRIIYIHLMNRVTAFEYRLFEGNESLYRYCVFYRHKNQEDFW